MELDSHKANPSTICREKKIFKIYSLVNYNLGTSLFIQNNYEEHTIKELESILKKNNNYHFRIHKNEQYIIFGDCDNYKDNNPITFFELFINFLKSDYDIDLTLDDISYTENKNKLGSYHYSIPKYYCSCNKLKEIHYNFYKKHIDIFKYYDTDNKLNKVVDYGIYTDKWFRYPNQTKENKKGTEHFIKKGKLIDFIVEYIPKESICIDSYKSKNNEVINKFIDNGVYVFDDNKTIQKNYTGIINKINVDTMKLLIECLKDEHFLSFDSWRDILFICYNCNNDEKIVDYLTDRSKVGKYKNVTKYEIKKQFYSNSYEPEFNKFVLYSYARKDNKDNLYDKYFGEVYDEYDFEYNTIDMNYLNYKDINDKFKNSKYCVLKSRYGSGKTTFIKKLIEKEYSDKRIIFLTMRQSLARNINKDFKELGFVNYLDKLKDNSDNIDINHDNNKVIISIDSLKKITYTRFMKLKIKPYDLVICDEFCSLLSHFDYNKLQEPELLHHIFESIIKTSKQTYFLDGDISNREIKYLQTYYNYDDKPLFNINNKKNYNIIIEYDSEIYYENILNDLKNNKKICIASMSSNFVLDIYNRFSDDYKCLIVYSKTDDEIKTKLENVEELFMKYDLVIYSPTITVGVDFNKNYFDKIYGYMCYGSVCPRVFFQMLFRVRQTKENDIMILTDNKINMKSWSNIVPFEEIRTSIYGDTNIDAYQYIRLWNKFEIMNANIAFLNIFSYLCKLKNYNYVVNNKVIKSYNKEKANYNVIEIYNAKNIDNDEFNTLMKKIKQNDSTKLEKLSVEKYIYADKFDLNLNKKTEKDFKKYYQKTHIIKGFLLGFRENKNNNKVSNIKLKKKLPKKYENILGTYEEITTLDEKYYNNSFDKKILDTKHKYYSDLINLLDLNNKKLDKDEFINKIDDVCNILNNEIFRTTFNMNKFDKTILYTKDDTINTKLLLGKLNTIFDNFGVCLKLKQTGDIDNRQNFYILEPINILPKKYKDYFYFMYKSIYTS